MTGVGSAEPLGVTGVKEEGSAEPVEPLRVTGVRERTADPSVSDVSL